MTVVAVVGGVPISVGDIDAREKQLRAGRLASTLPRHGTSEARQLRRWLTQVVAAEHVIAAEARARGLTGHCAPTEEELLPDTVCRLEMGSIGAAVLSDTRARALFAYVTADVDVSDAAVDDYQARNPRRFGSRVEVRNHLREAARRRAFRIWLDARVAALVELAPGYEHPGDPRQPDNTHRH